MLMYEISSSKSACVWSAVNCPLHRAPCLGWCLRSTCSWPRSCLGIGLGLCSTEHRVWDGVCVRPARGQEAVWVLVWGCAPQSTVFGMVFAFGLLAAKKLRLLDDSQPRELFVRPVPWLLGALSVGGILVSNTVSDTSIPPSLSCLCARCPGC